jgi:hypothetical protein
MCTKETQQLDIFHMGGLKANQDIVFAGDSDMNLDEFLEAPARGDPTKFHRFQLGENKAIYRL